MSDEPGHIPFEWLVDAAQRGLPGYQHDAVTAHLSACMRCADDRAWIHRSIELMTSDQSEEAPEAVRRRAAQLIRTRQAPRVSLPHRILAVLRFDSGQQPLALGVRNGGAATRQLLLQAEANHLDLRIAPLGELWSLAGQVLGECGSGLVNLASVETEVATVLDDACAFMLPS